MESNNRKEKTKAYHLKRLLNYKTLVKQIPFFLFMTFLAVMYIYNGHMADKTIRNITKTRNEVKELQFEYKDAQGDVLKRSKQSELIQAVEPLGLKELTTPPVLLIDSTR